MFIEPTEDTFRLLMERGIDGPVTMLNLLRFRDEADYSAHPELAPSEPISGQEAYQVYMEHTRPFLAAAGGDLRFIGAGGANFIGPLDERWDLVLLVQQDSVASFIGMAQNPEYLAGIGHRTAALEDSRLLPIVELGG